MTMLEKMHAGGKWEPMLLGVALGGYFIMMELNSLKIN